MNKSLALAATLLLASSLASAQGLSPTKTGGTTRSAASRALTATKLRTTAVEQLSTDHVVALVNSEPVTNYEVRTRIARLQAAPGAQLPPRDELLRQAMEHLILERIQLQMATEYGLKVDDATLAQTEEGIARQNGLSVEALRARVKAIGQDPESFRTELRNEILLQRLREREVDNRVKISEQEIDADLAERLGPDQAEINLAQVLVRVPEDADAATIESLRQRAEQVAQRASSGADFAELAREFSDAPDRAKGGELGLRSAERYPTLFVDATSTLKPGEIARVVRSGAGFHVLKLLNRRSSSLPDAEYTLTRARHILLRPGVQLTQEAAIARLADMRRRITSGSARFEDLARKYSQDDSASAGGELGWAGPGQFVPEFEQTMNPLAPGQISEPLVSRFGVHLIQVLERRLVPMSVREQREWVRGQLRERKLEEAYETWSRELRGRAYVEYREPPQ